MFSNYERASSVMVIMAQPLDINVQPVWICYFATNNKFNSSDVQNWIAFITSELNNNGIRVETYSAEGDLRELKMMRDTLQLGICGRSHRIISKHIMPF